MNLETKTKMNNTQMNDTAADFPLWKPALRKLRSREDYGYGLKLPTSWFEQALARKRDDDQFAFDMLEMRRQIESEDGYYLRCRTEQDDETKIKVETWQIPSAEEHEEVAKMFEAKLTSYAHRSVDIRVRTLNNESAQLSDEARRNMDAAAEHAAIRAVLLKRQKSITSVIRKYDAKLLT